MQNYTERHHAFISATYYRIMKEEGFHDFRAAFRMATQLYAQQRGSRMAQRAIRDGRELDFAAYRYYGEWEHTPEADAELSRPTETTILGDDRRMQIFGCPWSSQYLDMDLMDGANDYCADLDISIARGFNPYIVYEVEQTMHKNRDFCIHYHRNACNDKDYGPKDPANVRNFEFHCAHVYKAYSEVMTAIYKSKGIMLNAKVLEAFAEKYGRDMADKLLEYRNHDFNTIE